MAQPTRARSFYSSFYNKMRDVIIDQGWYIQVVGTGECDEPDCDGGYDPYEPAFGYTVGLTRYRGHPEVITFGLSDADFRDTLTLLAETVRAGREITDQAVLDELFGVGRTRMLAVANSSTHLCGANAMYRAPGAPPLPALQLVWSDDAGRFPWQAGFAHDTAMHPLLGNAA